MAIRKTLLSLLFILFLTGEVCYAQNELTSESNTSIKHIVLVWLKEPDNMEARQKLIEVSKSFKEEIPGVLEVSAGTALNKESPEGEDPFDVAIIITFPDEQSLKNYDTHPKHRKAVEEVLLPVTERIAVYDFVEQ